MLERSKAYSGFAVDDLAKARQFYGETLGLEVTEFPVGLTLNLPGDREYEGFGQDETGISRTPEAPVGAWFTDPAGNILCVHEPFELDPV